MIPGQKLPPCKCIAIDVDGTLLINGQINHALANWAKAKHAAGFEIIVWSARGTLHAQRAAHAADLTSIAAAVVSKPGFLVDDQGWEWARYTAVITNLDAPA